MASIDSLIEEIDKRLIHPSNYTANHSKGRKYLLGIYKQLVKSRKGHQANGEYYKAVQNEPQEAIKLIAELSHKLELFGLDNHAQRLKQQYNLMSQEQFSENFYKPDKDSLL